MRKKVGNLVFTSAAVIFGLTFTASYAQSYDPAHPCGGTATPEQCDAVRGNRPPQPLKSDGDVPETKTQVQQVTPAATQPPSPVPAGATALDASSPLIGAAAYACGEEARILTFWDSGNPASSNYYPSQLFEVSKAYISDTNNPDFKRVTLQLIDEKTKAKMKVQASVQSKDVDNPDFVIRAAGLKRSPTGGSLRKGMTWEQLRCALGFPDHRNEYDAGESEQDVYQDYIGGTLYVYLRDDVVTDWQTEEHSQ